MNMLPEESDDAPPHKELSEESRLQPDQNGVGYSTTLVNPSRPTSPPLYTYQELPGGVMCPTCSGAGRIPRGQEDDLVALIPYRDDRLRPRRTWLYVILSILFCGAVAGIMCAFLLTKPVHMSIHNITTTGIYLNVTAPRMVLDLEITYNISNSNFPSIHLKNMTVIGTQTFSTQPVVSNTSNVNLRVGGRSQTQFIVNVTGVFVDDVLPKYCDSSQLTRLFTIEFVSSLQYHLMTQVSSISSKDYLRVRCTEDVVPPYIDHLGDHSEKRTTDPTVERPNGGFLG